MLKRRSITISIALILAIIITIASLFFIQAPQPDHITWGVNFSKEYASYLGVDWEKAYLAILEDLKAKDIKLFNRWSSIEPEHNTYVFKDTDWQINQATKHQARIIYVTGMKSGRWPECHLPDWANTLSQKEQQTEILAYLTETVHRYKNNPTIIAWQVENEPLFDFGICPWYDADFLKKEVALIKSLDPTRPIIISDTGEYSFWITAARIGDVVGTTLYRKVWVHLADQHGFYTTTPIPPSIYWLKTQLIQKLFHKKVINIELQAEPWFAKDFHQTTIEEQLVTMDPHQFQKNIIYAQKTGFDTFYFWGAEWWYWMKEQQQPDIWNMAKAIISKNI